MKYRFINIKGKSIACVEEGSGAWVATSFALRHESRLKSLTVVDAGIPGLIPDEIFKPGNASRIWQFYFHAVGESPEFLTEGREREYLSWYFYNKAVVKDAISESDIDRYANQYRRKHAISNGFGYYRAFMKSAEQNRDLSKSLPFPCLPSAESPALVRASA